MVAVAAKNTISACGCIQYGICIHDFRSIVVDARIKNTLSGNWISDKCDRSDLGFSRSPQFGIPLNRALAVELLSFLSKPTGNARVWHTRIIWTGGIRAFQCHGGAGFDHDRVSFVDLPAPSLLFVSQALTRIESSGDQHEII